MTLASHSYFTFLLSLLLHFSLWENRLKVRYIHNVYPERPLHIAILSYIQFIITVAASLLYISFDLLEGNTF